MIVNYKWHDLAEVDECLHHRTPMIHDLRPQPRPPIDAMRRAEETIRSPLKK